LHLRQRGSALQRAHNDDVVARTPQLTQRVELLDADELATLAVGA